MSLRSVLTCIALLSTTGWAQYTLEDDYTKDGNFFNMFSFFTASDPTHGTVNYVDRDTAQKNGLINFSNGQAYMGVDYTNKAPNGRASVRVTSNKSYNSGLVILDLAKMPASTCGTWPAFWMVGSNWPNNGEIDIIEGVNDQSTNDVTLHTNSGCSISANTPMTGHVNTPNCDVKAAGQADNQGCQIATGNTQTYGTGFNNVGGGVYATEWTSSAINVYFFPRSKIPADITSGKPNPAGWGSPMAAFSGGCNIPDHFKNLQIVFDLTFCGDWAGNVWGNSGCASKASTCQAFVANNPAAFKDSSWLVNSLKVYQASKSTPSKTTAAKGSDSDSDSESSIITDANVAPVSPSPSPVQASSSPVEVSPVPAPATSVAPAPSKAPATIVTSSGSGVGYSASSPGTGGHIVTTNTQTSAKVRRLADQLTALLARAI
ncbi:hypothetical protein AMS68_001259 [Peltaster fructicola]|uniref:endo-1,3(4)-beta-glucanase n=1 Tax=Peltaster fructicola TaxID=286661 RepID=A0A6H0XLW3_9PEZI|nr:hypothetical protein AMS68_001259 [Peltaster fructicola]